MMRTPIAVAAAMVALVAIAAAAILVRFVQQPQATFGAPATAMHFGTLAPGASLPSGSQCSEWVRNEPIPENKRVNKTFNQATGHGIGDFFPASDDPKANELLAPRVGGQFTGTTAEILRWAACKWGLDEDVVAAQAAVESWWRQTNLGDWSSDPSSCPPGHGLGADGVSGKCPESYGILQNRYPYERASWPGIQASTAMNADVAYGIWRACFEGYELWLNDVERGAQYAAGDAWGCIGRWYAGRWHTAAADGYTDKVRDYLSRRVWRDPKFQES